MKKKILFILHYPPPVHGASMVGEYIKTSNVVNSAFDTKYIHLGTTRSFRDRKKFTFRKMGYFFRLCFNCVIANLTFKPDTVYLTMTSQGMGFFKDAIIIFLLKLGRAKRVYHFHNKGVSTKSHSAFYRKFYKMVFKGSKVILLSPRLFKDIEEFVTEDQVYYCPNGVPKIDLNAIAQDRYLQSKADVNILFLSNLIKSKGVHTLLEACKILKDKQKEFQCVFVGSEGDVSKRDFKERLEQLDLVDSVKYVGKKFNEEKNEIFQKADIFAFPTAYPNECFPLVLLEALQYNLPIISTSEGAIEDIVVDNVNGFIIKSNSPNELSIKLEELIDNPSLRTKMGIEGRQNYINRYSLDIFEKNLTDILKKI